MTRRISAGALAVLMMLAPVGTGVSAQQGASATASDGAVQVTTLDPYLITPPTAGQMAENAERRVVLHFMGTVSATSALSLVMAVQNYQRVGFRNFVLQIQSPGGSVDSALYAYETLKRMPVTIDTVAMGSVDSAGVLLYCIGEKRHAVPGSSFMFHPMVTRGMTQSRRSEEAGNRSIEAANTWIDTVFEDCFGGMPEEWDTDRRDYRAPVAEAREIGLSNADGDYWDAEMPTGAVSYISTPFMGGYVAQ